MIVFPLVHSQVDSKVTEQMMHETTFQGTVLQINVKRRGGTVSLEAAELPYFSAQTTAAAAQAVL